MRNITTRYSGWTTKKSFPPNAAPTPGGSAGLPGVDGASESDAKFAAAEFNKIGTNGGIQWWTTYDRVRLTGTSSVWRESSHLSR